MKLFVIIPTLAERVLDSRFRGAGFSKAAPKTAVFSDRPHAEFPPIALGTGVSDAAGTPRPAGSASRRRNVAAPS